MKMNNLKKLRRETTDSFPLSLSAGMHVSAGRVRAVYPIMLSAVSLCGLFGSVFTFITACKSKGADILPTGFAAAAVLICHVIFTAVFALGDRFPKISKALTAVILTGLSAFAAYNFKPIVRGFQYLTNKFMGCVFEKYADKPFYFLSEFFYYKGEYLKNEYCARLAAVLVIAVMALGVCSFVRSPNILVFICATFPLPELCLYFGLVPNYACFGLLAASWCGAAAADIARLGIFSDKGAKPVFSKTSAQSCLAAAVIMLISFAGAELYADAIDFKRPDSVKEFRNGVVNYMQDFSWDKLYNDMHDAFFPEKNGRLTHDGKLGNTESVEFSGRNMLEVTLPSDCGGLYLKGFTGIHYTGSKWDKGEAVPILESNLTSPEFLSGRILKQFEKYGSLRAKDVITRNVGVSAGVRYFPVNGAGMLETDGIRRRYGVYFPKGDWRSVILAEAGDLSLSGELAADELKMREYAYRYCLDVPETFTAYDDFFKDFEGGSQADTLIYIRRELARRCSYALESGKKPFGADFAQWFLTENKQGSCTHFASAATLLCRSMGIPARYCEGFVIKEEDIREFPDNDGYTTVSVPDSRAHAWAEVYVDGFGWMSFESTPGYGNMILEKNGSEEGFGEAPASEITSVSTEAPAFTENPGASSAETAVEGFSETEVSASETASKTAATVLTENEYTDPSPDGNTAENAVGEASEVGTSVSYKEVGQSSEPQMNGEASDVSEQPEIGPAPEENKSGKKLPAAVIGALFIIISAAAAVLVINGIRRLVFALRLRRLSSAPDKAAAHMYRLLLAASGEENIPEELAMRLEGSGIPRELTDTIVSSAMKARFGGGITKNEAEQPRKALEQALRLIRKNKGSFGRLISWLAVRDRYLEK